MTLAKNKRKIIIRHCTPLIPRSQVIEDLIIFSEKTYIHWDIYRLHELLPAIDEYARASTGIARYIHEIAYYLGKQLVNVKGYCAPFDHSNLWYIPPPLVKIANSIDDNSFLDTIWQSISAKKFIQLSNPIVCNPKCLLCQGRNGLYRPDWDKQTFDEMYNYHAKKVNDAY